jgi:hypothetical protein
MPLSLVLCPTPEWFSEAVALRFLLGVPENFLPPPELLFAYPEWTLVWARRLVVEKVLKQVLIQ